MDLIDRVKSYNTDAPKIGLIGNEKIIQKYQQRILDEYKTADTEVLWFNLNDACRHSTENNDMIIVIPMNNDKPLRVVFEKGE